MVGQLNDGPASQAAILFKDNQQQASIASGDGVMPRQPCLGWVLLGQPCCAICKRHCPDLSWRSPVYKTGTLTAKPQQEGVLRRVVLLATESVESEGLCVSKVCQWCDLFQGSSVEVQSLL